MSTSNFQFFATRDEVISMLAELRASHDLWLIAPQNESFRIIEPQDLASEGCQDLSFIFVATAQPQTDQLVSGEVVPARLGWCQLDLPAECGNQLCLADFAAKSDWYDEETGAIVNNTTLMRTYRKLRQDLRGSLKSPVWAKNVKTGRTSRYRDMGISAGAERWERKGGELRQRGVANVIFSARTIESGACS